MDHFVEQGIGNRHPSVPAKVLATDDDRRLALGPGLVVPQLATHSTGESDSDRRKGGFEPLLIQPLMKGLQLRQSDFITRQHWLLHSPPGRRRWDERAGLEIEKDPRGGPTLAARQPRPSPLGQRGNHLVRGKGVTAMNPETAAPIERDHNPAIRVKRDRRRPGQAKSPEPGDQV